jgi:hypothetical protein
VHYLACIASFVRPSVFVRPFFSSITGNTARKMKRERQTDRQKKENKRYTDRN